MTPTLPAPTIDTLIKMGLFHSKVVEDLGFNHKELQCALEALPEGSVFSCNHGWTAIYDETNLATLTILRIAGALDVYPVPTRDISLSLVKMLEWGDLGKGQRGKNSPARQVARLFESNPSDAVVRFLCKFIDADVSRYDAVDFSNVSSCIRPSGVEQDILAKLNLTTGGYAPTSWLSRRLNSKPPRSTLDYTIMPKVPFVFKEEGRVARLLGRTIPVTQNGGHKAETFIGMSRSSDGTIVALEYKLNEEAVEGNSFNVSPQCKPFVAGEYVEINTKVPLKFKLERKDARKFSGIGVAIRRAYPNYENCETAFVILDRENGLATVEVGMRHERKFEARIAHLMKNGISARETMLSTRTHSSLGTTMTAASQFASAAC